MALKPEQEEIIILKQEGIEDVRFSYKFSTRAELGDDELKSRIMNGEGGTPYQLNDYMTEQPL